MPRDYHPRESALKARARRQFALDRTELRRSSELRQSAVSPTSFAVKKIDIETQRLIDEALAKRGATNG
jgi:hypothetical protein